MAKDKATAERQAATTQQAGSNAVFGRGAMGARTMIDWAAGLSTMIDWAAGLYSIIISGLGGSWGGGSRGGSLGDIIGEEAALATSSEEMRREAASAEERRRQDLSDKQYEDDEREFRYPGHRTQPAANKRETKRVCEEFEIWGPRVRAKPGEWPGAHLRDDFWDRFID